MKSVWEAKTQDMTLNSSRRIHQLQGSVTDLGEGPRGAAPPLFLDQTEARRTEKKFFEDRPQPLI